MAPAGTTTIDSRRFPTPPDRRNNKNDQGDSTWPSHSSNIDPARSRHVLSVSGKLVVPGLIDLHAHVYPYGSAIGIAPR